MSSTQNLICRSLRCSGLDKRTTLALTNLIGKWVQNSGEEWTVNRLKAIKTYYLQRLSGNRDATIEWQKMNLRGIPHGFTRVFSMKKPQKVLSALMVYSSFVAHSVTKAQRDKFYSSVTAAPVDVPDSILSSMKSVYHVNRYRLSDVHDGWTYRFKSRKFWSPESFSSRNIRIPTWTGTYDPTTGDYRFRLKSEPMAVATAFSIATYHPAFRRWFRSTKDTLPEKIKFLLGQIDFMAGPVPPQDRLESQIPVGRIGYIQEPGYKLRSVANPLPIMQFSMSRLGICLYNHLKRIPEDCTYDQEKGVRDVQLEIQNGQELESIDLSDATNNFPYSLTYRVVSKAPGIFKEDLDLWDYVSTGQWQTPEGKFVRWTKGQPLGTYPSFAAFALSHHTLVRSVAPRFYRILGDDIVVDKEAAVKLRSLYQQLGCPISESKCVSSSRMAEFGGKVILSDRVLVQPKTRSLSDHNFLDLLRNLGPIGLGYLRPRQRRIAKMFSELPKGTHPYALGWNPKGKPYEQRLEEGKTILEKLSKENTFDRLTPQGELLQTLRFLIELKNSRPEIHQGLRYKLPDSDTYVVSDNVLLEQDSEDPYQIYRGLEGFYDSSSVRTTMILSGSVQPYEVDQEGLALRGTAWYIPGSPADPSVTRYESTIPGHSPVMGDPRGRTTLEVMEDKLFHDSSPRRDNTSGNTSGTNSLSTNRVSKRRRR